ncbi:LysR family transcriptional regulator [Hyphomonas pacifica]|uniref:LysR family transcriptional regulator n=1 Tax=Hyphomonas pacifica TaxID=1280941 RepID=UPI000DD3647D|nr:LysR family transcriptional regulator [Hyphomonas pacifica]
MKRGFSAMQGPQDAENAFDWDRLRVFRAVALTGSMSAAAERLGGSLPTVSRRMSDLETNLRAELFCRTPRGITLTKAGETLLRHVELIADTVEAAQWELTAPSLRENTSLHIACSESLAASWVAPRMAAFLKESPQSAIQLSVYDGLDAEEGLFPDIHIQHSKPTQPDIITRRIGRSHYMAFTSRAHSTPDGTPKSFADLLQQGCLVHSAYTDICRSIPNTEKRMELLRQTNSLTTMVALCRAGLAPALLPAHYAECHPDLTAHPELTGPALDIWISSTPRTRSLKRGDVVIEWLTSVFSPQESLWFRQSPPIFQIKQDM